MAISKELRVGAFVMLGLFVAGLVVFLIGDEKRLFDAKVVYHTSFSDVQGLKGGASARLGGVDIGTVAGVRHSESANDPRLHVELHIVKSEAIRLHDDAVARIVNKGLLGDKMVELEGGSQQRPLLVPGGHIKGEDPTNFLDVFNDVAQMTRQAHQILANFETTSKTLADPQVQEDLRQSVHSVALLLREASQGKGYLHRLLADSDEADRISHLLATIDRTGAEVQRTVSETQKVIARINEGPGLLHELAYGSEGVQMLAQVGHAADEVATALQAVHEGNGLAHAVLYGGDEASAQLLSNLGAMSLDLRRIVGDLRAGKGTLGALLVDPSVYEDVKSVLGNIQRNEALRALVRYSIRQDEKKPEIRVVGPAPRPLPNAAAPAQSRPAAEAGR